MKLIVGLGNPGSQYENTRHNAGFIAIDEFAKRHNLEFSLEPKLKGAIAKAQIDGEKVFLLKPMTYMNLSGESVIAVLNYYKIEVEDMIVISDDLDSPLGRIRLRDHGSSGGHNGHKNIVNHIHTETYKRIKIGIGRDEHIPVVVVAPPGEDYKKIMSNLQEVKARGADILGIGAKGDKDLIDESDNVFLINPEVDDILAPLVYIVPLQLLSYHVSVIRNLDPDKPKNLAKCVTVE